MTSIAASPPSKLLAVARVGLRQTFVERGELVARSLFVVMILLVFSRLWTTVHDMGALPNTAWGDLLWYLAVTEWITLGTPQLWIAVQEDVRTGDVAYLLPRPMSYVSYRVSEGLGRLVARMLAVGIVALGTAYVFTGGLPSSPSGLLLAIPVAFLAAVVTLIFGVWLGLTAFWLQDASPAYFIFQKLLFVLGGLILPLSIYPDWLNTLAHCTPFADMLYGPASLIFDPDPQAALWTSLRLVGWGALAWLLTVWTFARARRALEVNGG